MSHEPEVCLCGRQATGLAIGDPRKPTWICPECVPIMEFIKDVRRPTAYELKAREGGMEAAGEVIAAYGSDLSAYSEEQALMLVGACWRGTADRIRKLLREGEAPW
jgi:Family of unknown function (DUF6511)